MREKLEKLLRRQPFQPIRIRLTDGRVFNIPYRGMTLVADSYMNIGIPITEGPFPICDHTEHVPFKLIDQIEESVEIPRR